MYCIKCGKKNIPGSKFCYSCGTALVGLEETGLNQPTASPNEERINPATPGQETPPPGWLPPSGGPPTGPYDPNWRPPYPYGYPPLPRRTQDQHFPVAPGGKPYIVQDHPEAFHAYKNKDDKQVYAAFATVRARFYAVLVDTLLVFFPLQFISTLLVVLFNQDLLRKLTASTGSRDQDQLNSELSLATPGWVPLAVFTVYLLYCILLTWLWNGQTLGKKILRIKVIRKDGHKLDFNTVLTRNLFGYCFGLGNVAMLYSGPVGVLGSILWVVVGLGFSAIFFDPLRRGWHDRLADTLVVGRNELVQGVNY